MMRIPLGDWDTPGCWSPHLRDDGSQGAVFVCPLCKIGHVLTYAIKPAEEKHGLVQRREPNTPSVVCMTAGCKFKDDLLLLWWNT